MTSANFSSGISYTHFLRLNRTNRCKTNSLSINLIWSFVFDPEGHLSGGTVVNGAGSCLNLSVSTVVNVYPVHTGDADATTRQLSVNWVLWAVMSGI